jgi:uncharacterized membrane protein (DUF485 family)
MSIWYFYSQLGILLLVWYIFPILVCFRKKNMGTLIENHILSKIGLFAIDLIAVSQWILAST